MGTSNNQPTAEQCHAILIIEDPELQLETLIEEQLHNLDPMSRDFCIYKVPLNLRQVNQNAYTPEQVSIGPLHHRRNELQPWEKIKLRYLQAFLDHAKISLIDMVKVVKEWEGRARSHYGEKIDLSSNEFVKMMIVDSCFIIEVIVRATRKDAEVRNYLNNPELIVNVRRDMILLENQVPFFVIEGLFDRGIGDDINAKFLDLAIMYLYGAMLVLGTKDIVYVTKVVERVKRHIELGGIIAHIVDLLRICHLPSTQRVATDRGANL